MILAGLPLPERPRGRDEAHDRGWDPASVLHDRVTPEPLTVEWQEALDGANEAARHLRDDVCGVPSCGVLRCGTCDERLMCTGPEPAVNTCAAHDDECVDCNGANPCRDCAAERRAA